MANQTNSRGVTPLFACTERAMSCSQFLNIKKPRHRRACPRRDGFDRKSELNRRPNGQRLCQMSRVDYLRHVYLRHVTPNRNAMPATIASVVYGRFLIDSSSASTKWSDTSRTALAASRPLSCASESTSSTLDLARLQAALPRAVRISETWSARRWKSSRSFCTSLCISAEAPAAASRTSRTVSRASLTVSRAVCDVVDALFMTQSPMHQARNLPRQVYRAQKVPFNREVCRRLAGISD